MSQSDYIQRKKIGVQLQTPNQNKFPNSLESNDYTLFKQYSLENTVINSSKRYNQLTPVGSIQVFNIELSNYSKCPPYVLCKNTQTRPYRKAVHPAPFNPYASTGLQYVTGPSNETLHQLTYVKQRPIRSCPPCMYGTTRKKCKQTNYANTNFTACSNYRYNQAMCNLVKHPPSG